MRSLVPGLVLMGWILLDTTALAQSGRNAPTPVILGVYPPGGSRNSTVEWTLTGRGLAKSRQPIGLGTGIELVDYSPVGDTQAKVTVKIAPEAPLGYRELRVDGPDGVSNLVLIRVDSLTQVKESEPNDELAQALEVTPGTAVVGILRATDIDSVKVKGKPGLRLTIDLEARRLGTAFSPVVTVLNSSGTSLGQGRGRPGGDRDCRLGVTIPVDGVIYVQVRDNTYGGSDLSAYRLRIDTAPFATGLFPLGGPRGKSTPVTLSGGSLPRPATKSVVLPEMAGPDFDLGEFPGPEGSVLAPMRFVVGDEGEKIEPPQGSTASPMPVQLGDTINGRIDRPGEVDRYRLKVKKGERLRLKIQAAELGSWIDSVVTIRDEKGASLAENDDEGGANAQGNRVNTLGLVEGSSDSTLEYSATADGNVLIEVADRYGLGGPEYPYRLAVGKARADFTVNLLLGNPNAGVAANGQAVANTRLAPGLMGVFNLKPGTVTPINFLVKSEGSPGFVTLKVEGLPPGVVVEPVKVDLSDSGKPGEPRTKSAADSLVFRVESYADPIVGMISVTASAEPEKGKPIIRLATAIVGVQQANAGVPTLPITRTLNRFPLRILGDVRNRLVGPPPPPSLARIVVPGPLLQGDRLDLQLEFDQSPLADPGFQFEAKAEGLGLATNTVISSGQSSEDEDVQSDVLVRVLASPKTVPGIYPIVIRAQFTGGRLEERTISVVVRRPLDIMVRAESLEIKPGGTTELRVAIRREPGCDGEVDLKVEGLPRGVKLAQAVTLAEGVNEGTLKFEMAATARPLKVARELTISAVARMPRGAVSLESPVRPMLSTPTAEQ